MVETTRSRFSQHLKEKGSKEVVLAFLSVCSCLFVFHSEFSHKIRTPFCISVYSTLPRRRYLDLAPFRNPVLLDPRSHFCLFVVLFLLSDFATMPFALVLLKITLLPRTPQVVPRSSSIFYTLRLLWIPLRNEVPLFRFFHLSRFRSFTRTQSYSALANFNNIFLASLLPQTPFR